MFKGFKWLRRPGSRSRDASSLLAQFANQLEEYRKWVHRVEERLSRHVREDLGKFNGSSEGLLSSEEGRAFRRHLRAGRLVPPDRLSKKQEE